jgi:hypothetical protein
MNFFVKGKVIQEYDLGKGEESHLAGFTAEEICAIIQEYDLGGAVRYIFKGFKNKKYEEEYEYLLREREEISERYSHLTGVLSTEHFDRMLKITENSQKINDLMIVYGTFEVEMTKSEFEMLKRLKK